jgi:acetylornithine deacetylase/succinyl-diaminopimelate desuccinylase-like protein
MISLFMFRDHRDRTVACVSDLKNRVHDLLPGLVGDLKALVRIQSVSADPDRRAEVEQSARKTAELLAAEGVGAEIVRAHDGAPPAVIGERTGPQGAPVVLLYAHHDVQPENDPADWASPPFEPTVRGERLYGRGAADDKAGIAVHVGALRALGADLPVTVRFFIEGEEEVSSETLPDLLRQYRDRLAADVIVIADAANWAIGVPSLTTSLRGLIRVDVEVRTLTHAVHSGMWGGLVPDAIMALTRLLATLWTPDGSPAVEGLVSGSAADVDYPEERLRAESGAAPGTRWIGTGSAVERLWARPAITVTGLDAPKVAGASNTLDPVARARVTVRLAPGDTSANALTRLQEHLEGHVPWGARLTTTVVDAAEPTVLPTAGPAYAAARSALAEAWDGVAPVDMGTGGSIPFIGQFQEMFPGASILVTGVEDPDTRAHGPNEGLHLPEFERAVLAEALLLQRLGAAVAAAVCGSAGR